MEFFRSAPFLRILPAFCLGIVFAFARDTGSWYFLVIFMIGACVLVRYLLRRRIEYSHRLIPGISLQLIFVSLGYFLTELNDVRTDVKHFANSPGILYKAVIDGQPVYKSGRLRVVAQINSVYTGGQWKESCGNTYIYFTDSASLNCSDEIIFRKSPAGIEAPLNPGSFDFKYYSSLRRIYHHVKLNGSEWKIVRSRNTILSFSAGLRNRFLNVFEKAGLRGQEYAVMSALVLGYDDEIDKSTMSAFSASGTLHVLSVSGMHVGIIFAALSLLFRFAEKKLTLNMLRTLILLICLWFYALLTGLSPSVIRSVMMFSFILLGKSMSRSSNIYNSLSLSALAIFLLFDPLMLFHPGFQLSYVAVAGIAYFYPKFYGMTYFNNWFADKIFSLVSVSLAAQLATVPIVIYYFHQFPNYFILANLIIIPLSTIGIFGGILLLFICELDFLLAPCGWLCGKVIFLLNESALFIERLPFSTWNGLMLKLPEVFLLSVLFVLIMEFIRSRSIKLLYASMIISMIFLSALIFHAIKAKEEKNIIFFSGTRDICFQFNYEGSSILFHTRSDSVKAKSISDSYCKSVGRSLSKRHIVQIDSSDQIDDLSATLLGGRVIVIGSRIVLNNPDGVNVKNPLCVFFSDDRLLNKFKAVTDANVIIRDNPYRKIENSPYAKSHRLSDGAKIISL